MRGELPPVVGGWTVAILLLGVQVVVAAEDGLGCSCVPTAAAAALVAVALCLAAVGATVFLRRRLAGGGTKGDVERGAGTAVYDNQGFCADLPNAVNANNTGGGPPYSPDLNSTLLHSLKDCTVPLQAADFAGLGFAVHAAPGGGVCVRHVLRGGPAAMSGRVHVGDRLMALTVVMATCTQDDASSLLSSASPYPVLLHLRTGKSTHTDAAATATATASPAPPAQDSDGPSEAVHCAESSFKSNSSGDLSKTSTSSGHLQGNREEEALINRADNSAIRISDSAIDQLVDYKLARDSKQGRHSERAIDVPDSALRASSAYGDLHPSLSERAIDITETDLSSSSGHKELQSSLSERAIDVPDSLLKSSDLRDLHYSLSDRALDVPTSKLKPASAFGELTSDLRDDQQKLLLGKRSSQHGDASFLLKSKILEESDGGVQNFPVSEVDSLPQESKSFHDANEANVEEASPQASPPKAVSCLGTDGNERANAACEELSSRSDAESDNNDESRNHNDIKAASPCVSVLSSEVQQGPQLDSRESSASLHEIKMSRETNFEGGRPTNIDVEFDESSFLRRDQAKSGSDSLESSYLRSELNASEYKDKFSATETLHREINIVGVNQKNQHDSNKDFMSEEVKSVDASDNSSDDEKSTEGVSSAPSSEINKLTTLYDDTRFRFQENSLQSENENEELDSRCEQFSNCTKSNRRGSGHIEAWTRESQASGASGADVASKMESGPKVSSPNDRSNIFGMYVNHEAFNEATNEAELSSSGGNADGISMDQNKEIKVELKTSTEKRKDDGARRKEDEDTESIDQEIGRNEEKSDGSSGSWNNIRPGLEDDNLPILKGDRKISHFSVDISKPKKSTFELRMTNSGSQPQSTSNVRTSRVVNEESDTSEVSLTENDLPEVDTYLTEISSVIHDSPKQKNPDTAVDIDLEAQSSTSGFGTVFGFRGFKKHIERCDTPRSNLSESNEIAISCDDEETEEVPVSKINSVSILRMNFESSSEIQPVDDESSLSSLSRHYLPESEAHLTPSPIKPQSNCPRNLIEIRAGLGSKDEEIEASSDRHDSAMQLHSDQLEAEAESSIHILSAHPSFYQRVNSDEIKSCDTALVNVLKDSSCDEADDISEQPSLPGQLLKTLDSDSHAMMRAAEVALAHRKKKPSQNMGSSILIKTDSESTVRDEPSKGIVKTSTFSCGSADQIGIANSAMPPKQTSRERRPLSHPGIIHGRIVHNSEGIRDDNLQEDNVYIVSNTSPLQSDLSQRTYGKNITTMADASEVTVVLNDEKYAPESDDMKKRAASLDDLSYIPNRSDDSLLERAVSLEFKLAHGDEKNSFRTRRNNLPRSSTSMREVERSSIMSVDNLLEKGRDHSPSEKRRSELNSNGHSHSVFVQSYRRDQRATSLEGIPSSLIRSNSSKLAVHQSNVTVRSNPTLSLSTHNISPTNLKVNYDSTEHEEQRGGVVSNIEISGDRGVSITSLTHSSPWPSTGSETDHLSSFDQSPPHSTIHSPSEMLGTTTIHVLETSMPPQHLDYFDENLGKEIDTSEAFQNQSLSLRRETLESDTEDEVTVTTGDASFFTGPRARLRAQLASESTHLNGNIKSTQNEFPFTDDTTSCQIDVQEGYQLPANHQLEKTISTSMTQIRVPGRHNPQHHK